MCDTSLPAYVFASCSQSLTAAAYKDAEGIKILGKRILVDVERGRTVKGWKPQRLGGGLGGRKKPEPEPTFSPAFVRFLSFSARDMLLLTDMLYAAITEGWSRCVVIERIAKQRANPLRCHRRRLQRRCV